MKGRKAWFIGLGLAFLLTCIATWWNTDDSRKSQLVRGRWMWDSAGRAPREIVEFHANGTWDAHDERDPTFQNMSGYWHVRRNHVLLRFLVIDPPNPPDVVFTISDDGALLQSSDGVNGTMRLSRQ